MTMLVRISEAILEALYSLHLAFLGAFFLEALYSLTPVYSLIFVSVFCLRRIWPGIL